MVLVKSPYWGDYQKYKSTNKVCARGRKKEEKKYTNFSNICDFGKFNPFAVKTEIAKSPGQKTPEMPRDRRKVFADFECFSVESRRLNNHTLLGKSRVAQR